jgi:ATP-dependent Clp protease ATP-binding subunit ClpX
MVYDQARIKKIAAMMDASKQDQKKTWTATAIFERLDSAIIGNERYKKALASCLSSYLAEAKIRNHLLVFGPSGTGKTYLLKQTLPDFGLPYVVIDSSSLVPSGYEGNTLTKSLTEFYGSNMTASERAIIVMDEFDKISEKANGGDTHKSHSIQSELLTNVEGKKEGCIDTRNSLWIFLGAFAYSDEMKQNPPKMVKNDLLKYGFKNELLGRITRDTITDIPTIEDVVGRVFKNPAFLTFLEEMKVEGFDPVDFEDQSLLLMAQAAQDPRYGMRIIPTLLGLVKDEMIFNKNQAKGPLLIKAETIKKLYEENM